MLKACPFRAETLQIYNLKLPDDDLQSFASIAQNNLDILYNNPRDALDFDIQILENVLRETLKQLTIAMRTNQENRQVLREQLPEWEWSSFGSRQLVALNKSFLDIM